MLQIYTLSQTYIYNNIVSREFPRVEIKPVIGNLDLVAIHDFLLENTISVSQSISPGWHVERSQGVQETGSQTTKTTITKSSIVLLVDDVLNAETEFREALCELVSTAY
jgi:hypothetical protein